MAKKPGTRLKSEDTAQPSHADSHMKFSTEHHSCPFEPIQESKVILESQKKRRLTEQKNRYELTRKFCRKFRMKVSKNFGCERKNCSSRSEKIGINPVEVGSFLVVVVNFLVILSFILRQLPY